MIHESHGFRSVKRGPTGSDGSATAPQARFEVKVFGFTIRADYFSRDGWARLPAADRPASLSDGESGSHLVITGIPEAITDRIARSDR